MHGKLEAGLAQGLRPGFSNFLTVMHQRFYSSVG